MDQHVSREGEGDGSPPPFQSAVSMLQRHMSEVCAGAAAVTISEYESGDGASVDALVERSRALVSSALDALEVVVVLYGEGTEAPADGEPGDRREEDAASVPPPACEGIADAVVLARMGLRHRLRSLRDLSDRATRWERLAAAGSALRTIQKSLSAVDRALADAEQIPPSLRFYETAVERSLAVRRRYVYLHRLIVQRALPSAGELRPRLRLIGNAIAHMLGLSVAAHLRTGDRALLMMAHAKVRDWLSLREDDAAHVSAGLRLWQDLVNIATMFLDVNKREELVQHDAALVRAALRDLAAAGRDTPSLAPMLEKLSAMTGRSPSLDALLEGPPAAVSAADLRGALEELDRSLGGAAGTSDTGPPASGLRSSHTG